MFLKFSKVFSLLILTSSVAAYGFVPKYKSGKPTIVCSYSPPSSSPFGFSDFPEIHYTVEVFKRSDNYLLRVVDRSSVLPENIGPGDGVITPIKKNETVYEARVTSSPDESKFMSKELKLSLDQPQHAFDNERTAKVFHKIFGEEVALTCKFYDRFDPADQVDTIQRCNLSESSHVGSRNFVTTFYKNQRGRIIAEVFENSFHARYEASSLEMTHFKGEKGNNSEMSRLTYAASKENNLRIKGVIDFNSVNENRSYRGQQEYRFFEMAHNPKTDNYERSERILRGESQCQSYIQLPQDTKSLFVFMTGSGPVVDEASVDRLRDMIAKLVSKKLIDEVGPEEPFGFEGGSAWHLKFSGKDARERLHKVYEALKTVEYESRSTEYVVRAEGA